MTVLCWSVQDGLAHPGEVRGGGSVALGQLIVNRNELVFRRESSRRTFGSLCAEFIIDGLTLPAAAGGITLGVMGIGALADGKDVVKPLVEAGTGLLLVTAAAARFYFLPDPQIESVTFADRTFNLTMRPLNKDSRRLVTAVRQASLAVDAPRLVLRVTNLVWGPDHRSEGEVWFGDLAGPMAFYSTEP